MSTNDTKRGIKAVAFGQRVYEYRDDEGVVYYSFTKAPSIISPPVRLKMRDRIGTHLNLFIVRMRQRGETLQVDGGEDG